MIVFMTLLTMFMPDNTLLRVVKFRADTADKR